MSFWNNFFAKRNDADSITDTGSADNTISVDIESESFAPKKSAPVYKELLARTCQVFGTRDSVLTTMAAHKTIPFDMSRPFTGERVFLSDLALEASYHSAARTNSIALAPFYADIYELSYDNPKLVDLVDDAVKNNVFENADLPYPTAGELSVALIQSLAKKEHRSIDDVYATSMKNMFPDGKNNDSMVYAGFRVAGHHLGIPDIPYETLLDACAELSTVREDSDIRAHMYSSNISNIFADISESKRAYAFLKQKYLENPDDDWYLIPLAKYNKNIIDLIQKPVHTYTYETIAQWSPDAARWLAASNNVRPATTSDNVFGIVHTSEFPEGLEVGTVPLNQERIGKNVEAFEHFQEVRTILGKWYSKIQDKDAVAQNSDDVEALESELRPWINSWSTFRTINEVLIANAEGDVLKEYQAMAAREYSLGLADERNGVDEHYDKITGHEILSDLYESIKDEGKRLQDILREAEAAAERKALAQQELLEAETALRAVTKDSSMPFG